MQKDRRGKVHRRHLRRKQRSFIHAFFGEDDDDDEDEDAMLDSELLALGGGLAVVAEVKA